MRSLTDMDDYWRIVEAIVNERGREVRRYRYFEDLWNTIDKYPQLIFLQAPMGAGKTEAVTTPFLRDLINGERRWHSLLYVLPTRSLVYSMFKRICKSLRACVKAFSKPLKIIPTYDHGGPLYTKPFLEGDLTITTYDSFFYTFYGFRSYGRHILLPLGKIAGSLVVMDEVHLLQDTAWYSLTLLPHHICNILRYGGMTIVMTATLPDVLKQEVMKVADKIDARIEYVRMNSKADKVERGRVKIELMKRGLLDSVIDIAKSSNKPLLMIFNTVERAARAYITLREEGFKRVELLHSRLTAQARRAREEIFEREVDDELIMITTQVAEVGIDYDFKTLATELSPIDSLIQRIGRCGRRHDGVAFISVETKSALQVYPRVVVKRTLENLDEDLLSRSITEIEAASELIDEIYRSDIIKYLRNSVQNELSEVLGFVKRFHEKVFSKRKIYEDVANRLVRLGVDLTCVLLPDDLYAEAMRSLTEGKTSGTLNKQFSQIIEERSIPISVSRELLDMKHPIPALLHEIGGRRMYLKIVRNISKRDVSGQEARSLDIKVEGLEQLSSSNIRLTDIFIINPSYYQFYHDNYQLGLVRPYDPTP